MIVPTKQTRIKTSLGYYFAGGIGYQDDFDTYDQTNPNG
jgi:hypothetical protein